MFYPGYLGLHCASSNSGKTTFWLKQLAAPHAIQKERIWIFSFQDDTQFQDFDPPCPVEVKTYLDLDPDDIPSGTFLLFDELSQALLRDPKVIDKIKIIYTTKVHHSRLSGAVGLVQNIYGTGAYPLISLSHGMTLNPLQSFNTQFLQLFRIPRPVSKRIEEFLLRAHSLPYHVTIFFNVPYAFQPLSQVLCLHADVDIWFPMNPNQKVYQLTEEAEKSLGPVLDKSFPNGVALVPLENIARTETLGEHDQEGVTAAERDEEALKAATQEKALSLLRNTVDPRKYSKFRRIWTFITCNKVLSVDPDNLVLHANQKYPMGLHAFISLLLKPSHLIKSKQSKKSLTNENAIALTRILLEDPSFSPDIIGNRALLQAAKKEGKIKRKKKKSK